MTSEQGLRGLLLHAKNVMLGVQLGIGRPIRSIAEAVAQIDGTLGAKSDQPTTCHVCGPHPFLGIRDEGCLDPQYRCPRAPGSVDTESTITPSHCGPVFTSYADLPDYARALLLDLEVFIGDMDGVTTVDDETIDASDAVEAFNAIVDLLRRATVPSAD